MGNMVCTGRGRRSENSTFLTIK